LEQIIGLLDLLDWKFMEIFKKKINSHQISAKPHNIYQMWYTLYFKDTKICFYILPSFLLSNQLLMYFYQIFCKKKYVFFWQVPNLWYFHICLLNWRRWVLWLFHWDVNLMFSLPNYYKNILLFDKKLFLTALIANMISFYS
jgi:hypothetical protein